MNFAAGHVFNFSLRPGTAAERLGERVPPAIRKKRSELYAGSVLRTAVRSTRQSLSGKIEGVLWERSKKVEGGWLLDGLTDNYLRVQVVEQSDPVERTDKCEIVGIGSQKYQGERLLFRHY